MSWLQLLAVGKSILNIEDRPTRYKMARQNLLPKFGPSEERGLSFTGTAPVVAAPVVPPAAMPEKIVEKPRAVRQPSACPPKETTMNIAEVEPNAELSTRSEAVMEAPVAAFPHERWTLIKNAFVRKPAPKSATTVKQGELKLDVIQVARNDLNDADLELVPAKPPPKAATIDETLADEEHEAAGMAFSRITTRLFGAGRT